MISAILLCASLPSVAQNDLIVLRNGTEIPSKVMYVDTKYVTYKENLRNKNETKQDLKEVYMIRFERRGNIYITEDCKRVTGENEKWEKNADRIYLVEGKEIQVTSLTVAEDEITYTPLGEKRTRGRGGQFGLTPSDVFMIKYSDGTKDIFTDLSVKEEPKAEEEPTVSEVKETERQVVFHNVKKGDTLSTIAKRYGVTANDLAEWNDLPKTVKTNTRLRVGAQLMIYVEPAQK